MTEQTSWERIQKQLEAILELDSRLRRLMLQITSATQGWTIPEGAGGALGIPHGFDAQKVCAELAALKQAYLEKAKEAAPPIGWPSDPVAMAAEAAQQLAFVSQTVLRDLDAAAVHYVEAEDLFYRAGRIAEAEAAALGRRNCAPPEPGGLDVKIAEARAKLSTAPPRTIEQAEALTNLAELMLTARDSFGARRELQCAEEALTAQGYREPPACQSVLHGMLDVMRGNGDAVEAARAAAEVVRLRALFRRVYDAQAAAWQYEDAAKAEAYREKIRDHKLFTT